MLQHLKYMRNIDWWLSQTKETHYYRFHSIHVEICDLPLIVSSVFSLSLSISMRL